MASSDELMNLTGKVKIANIWPTFDGSYSRVHQGEYQGRKVAVKVLKITGPTHSMRRKVDRERRVWGELNHPNILPLLGYMEASNWFGQFGALVSPWCINGDSASFLGYFGRSFSLDSRVDLWKGVIEGVNYLHSFHPTIVHGDLKPANILIDENCHPRICDFGLVRILLEEGATGLTTTTPHTGTERYLAFELVCEEMTIPTVASDIYALGCIGLDFVFLQSPHSQHKSNARGHIFLAIQKKCPPAERPESLTPLEEFYWDIIETCWKDDQNARPSAADLLLGLQRHVPMQDQWIQQRVTESPEREDSEFDPSSPLFNGSLLLPASPSFRTRPFVDLQTTGTELPYLSPSPSPTVETAYTGEATSLNDHTPVVDGSANQRAISLPPRKVVYMQSRSHDAHSVWSLPDPFGQVSRSEIRRTLGPASAPGLHAMRNPRSRLSIDSIHIPSSPKASIASPTINHSASPTTASPSLSHPPFVGIAFGFGRPTLGFRPLIAPSRIEHNVIIDSSPSRPFYVAAHSWHGLLTFLSQQRRTYLDASARARSLIYTTYSKGWVHRRASSGDLTPHLRVVLQFVKLGNGRKRVVLYLAANNPTPVPPHHPELDTSVAPYLFPSPDATKPLEDTPYARLYSTVSQPFPPLPLSMPHLSSYLQSALEESRSAKDSRKRLYQLVDGMTAPSRRIGSSLDFASSLFKRGHRNDRSLDADTTAKPIDSPSASKFNSMFKRLRRKSAGPRESLSDNGYLIVIPKDLAENV